MAKLTLDDEEIRGLEYHKDWNWLMLVVEKIITMGTVIISGNDCEIITYKDDNYDFISTYNIGKDNFTTLTATYTAIIEFIKWYNKNK